MRSKKIRLDTNKDVRNDFENIKVGDIAFDLCCSSMGNGFDGWTFKEGSPVVEITKTEIVTSWEEDEYEFYDRKTLINKNSSAYFLYKFQDAP